MFDSFCKAGSLATPLCLLFWITRYFGYETLSTVLIYLWLVVFIGAWVLFYRSSSD